MLEMLLVARYTPMFVADLFEYMQILIFVLICTHCYKTHGKWVTLQIFLLGMLYGLVLENGGPLVLPWLGFEGYFFEDMYHFYLFEAYGYGYRISLVPLATHLGWSNIFYVSVVLWEKCSQVWPILRKNPILGGLFISLSGLLQDLQLDIIATRFNWWIWNENLNPIYFGVPISNYLAWFWAVFMFGWVWVRIYGKGEPDVTKIPAEQLKEKTKEVSRWIPICWVLDLIGFQATFWILNAFGLIYV